MKHILTLFSLILFTIALQAQTVITVDNTTGSGADYTSLQAALDDANPGDTLQVHSSPNDYGAITIEKSIYIIGTGHNPAANSDIEVANISTITLKSNCANTTINGVYMTHVNVGTPIVDISDITFRNCRVTGAINGSNNANVHDWVIEGNLFVYGSINPNLSYNWLVRNNLFYTTTYSFSNMNSSVTMSNNLVIVAGNNLFNGCTGTTVNNNIFYVTAGATIIGLNNTVLSASNNLTYAGNGASLSNFPGTDNLNNVDPVFINATNAGILNYYSNNYRSEPGSPADNAGTDGADIGLYGGTFGYHQDGKPSDVPYMLSLGIQNPSLEAGELLNVIFSAQKNQ
jgi:hypothetical protein